MSRKLADRRARHRQKLIFWGLCAALLGSGIFLGDQRPHHLLMLYLEEADTREQIGVLRKDQADLQARHDRLMKDAFALESLAREKGLARPDELVYRIIPVPPAVHRATAESLAALAKQHADSVARAEAGRSSATY
ncbi:MAG: FtsB family cell division protein [Gemmatimonadota bacterium]